MAELDSKCRGWPHWCRNRCARGLEDRQGLSSCRRPRRTTSATVRWERQHDEQRVAQEQQARQHQRELLAKAADLLLDALWAKERELANALVVARSVSQAGVPVTTEDAAVRLLGKLDLAIYSDLICALPFVLDSELRERLRSVGFMVNGCLNLRASSPNGTPDQFTRAAIEVQRYFKWLRWNLNCGLQGLELPAAVEFPDVRRPETEMTWELPPGVPDYT